MADYGSEGWGFESLRACHPKPLRKRGFRLSPAEFDAAGPVSGQRLGRETSSPDVLEPSDEVVHIGWEQVGVAVHGHGNG